MNEMKKSLLYETKANDVDEKGIVTIAVNGIGIEDTQNDISMPGSFDVTLKEDMARMRHFLNHDPTKLIGVPLEGAEIEGNLVMTSQLNLEKQIGRDILADYKLYAEAGRTLEHSIGVQALKRDKADKRKVLQWKMFEFSTLTHWGSNPHTFLVNIKSAPADQVREAVNFIEGAFRQRGFSDERLKAYDMELQLLLKALAGDNIVTCPQCGHSFDYDSQPEHTFSQQALELAADYTRWITDGVVYEEMQKLKPEIRAEVTALLDNFKGDRRDFTAKSVADIMNYVRCPHCWARVYRSMLVVQEEKSQETEPATEEKAEHPAEETKKSYWQTINEIF